jgi:DNA gyrase subunit A
LLRSAKKMRQVVADELETARQAFSERRRTQIVELTKGKSKHSLLTATDLTPEKEAWVAVTPEGTIWRTMDDKQPRLSGNEAACWLVKVNTRDTLYLAAENGEAAAITMHAVPEVDSPSGGVHFASISPFQRGDKLAAVFTLPPKSERQEGWHVLSATRQGMLKKTTIDELPGPAANLFTLVKVNEGDCLGWLRLTKGDAEVLLLTANGMAIRFSEDSIRPMGLVAAGVMGIKLGTKDELVGMEILPQPGEVFMIATDGSGKRLAQNQLPKQGRYGQGVVAWKLPAKITAVGMTVGKGTAKATLFLAKLAPKSIRLDEAPLQGRPARGKSVLALKAGDRVTGLCAPWEIQRPVGKSPGKAPAKPRTRKTAATSKMKSPRTAGKK